jgi:hypothetical protein
VDAVKKHLFRNPSGFTERYEAYFASATKATDLDRYQKIPATNLRRQLLERSWAMGRFARYITHQYGRGDPLKLLVEEVADVLPVLMQDAEYVRVHGSETNPDLKTFRPIKGTRREDFQFSAFALLLGSGASLQEYVDLVSTAGQDRGYFFDLLVKSFVPDWQFAKKYKTDPYLRPWTVPILRILGSPSSGHATSMAGHMLNWCRLMRQFDWKPDPRPDDLIFFDDFAFEVALAVCAYDIDDSSFNDHPYYPRDLVEYYRANLRDTRDAWRPKGQGAGVPIIAPPPPAKADLSKSKRKNVARWVELVSDGDNDATEAVLEAIGKPRKFKEIGELIEALNDSSLAIHADIKDDATLVYQASVLAAARGLGEYEAPVDPPQGPARCSAALLHFAGWLRERGYRLVDLDGQDDAWHAVLVKAEYEAELQALSGALGLLTRVPEDVYND